MYTGRVKPLLHDHDLSRARPHIVGGRGNVRWRLTQTSEIAWRLLNRVVSAGLGPTRIHDGNVTVCSDSSVTVCMPEQRCMRVVARYIKQTPPPPPGVGTVQKSCSATSDDVVDDVIQQRARTHTDSKHGDSCAGCPAAVSDTSSNRCRQLRLLERVSNDVGGQCRVCGR